MWRRVGPSRTARTLLLRDRVRVAEFVERLCRLDFERIAVAHGEVLEGAGPATLRAAFRSYPKDALGRGGHPRGARKREISGLRSTFRLDSGPS